MSHLKKTIITPFEPRYSNRPDGAVCYKRKKALDVCIVKGTAATPCRRFACLSTTKLIRYYNKNKFFAKNFQSISVHFFDGLPDCCFSALFSANFLETAERAAVIARCLGEWLFGIYYFFNYAIE